MPAPAAAVPAAAGLRLSVDGPRATVSFDQLNAAEPTDLVGLGSAFGEIGRQITGTVRVVVVHGQDWSGSPRSNPLRGGPDARAVAGVGDVDGPLGDRALAVAQAGFGWLSERPDLLSVAVLRGVVEGFCLDLALACDLRVVADRTVLAWRPAQGCLPPLLGGHAALEGIVGYPRALEWRLAGRQVTGTEAFELGLASRVADSDGLGRTVDGLVSDLLVPPREVAAETKALVLSARGRRANRAAALRDEREAFLRLR